MNVIEVAKLEIKKTYLADDRPWVVGYSGGKDSTAVCQLIFQALMELDKNQRKKMVYIISSDTLIETPLIIQKIDQTLQKIQSQAQKLDLPIETHKVRPKFEDSFWSYLIGRGYPSPRQKFRWCTDRLKIEPANRFVLDKVSRFGEVIMVLGVRDSESQTRSQVIQSHTVEGKTLMRHSTLSNAFVYAPIKSFSLDDVWNYLDDPLQPSPWGDDNSELKQLYIESNGECPLIVDREIKESAGSCGNSRFGCWVCTVVKKDKALIGFINSGHNWLVPLLEFRDDLLQIRDESKYRKKHRINGQVYFMNVNLSEINKGDYEIVQQKDLGDYLKTNSIDLGTMEEVNILVQDMDGNYKKLGLGPYTMEARKMILKWLLETQEIVKKDNPLGHNFELIREEELKIIRRYWVEEMGVDDLPKLYNEVTGNDLDWEYNERPLLNEDQITDLEFLCKEYDVSVQLLKKMISLEQNYYGYKVRKGLFRELERILMQERFHL